MIYYLKQFSGSETKKRAIWSLIIMLVSYLMIVGKDHFYGIDIVR